MTEEQHRKNYQNAYNDGVISRDREVATLKDKIKDLRVKIQGLKDEARSIADKVDQLWRAV